MKIAIRADGGENIGMGHIMRCIALTKLFEKNGFQVLFIIKRNSAVSKLLSLKGINYIYLFSEDLEEELKEVISILDQRHINIVLTDSYYLSESYLIQLKRKVKLLISLDDNNIYNYPSDIVINGNIYANDLNYKRLNRDTLFLLGPDYTIFREEYFQSKPILIKERVKNMVITMGGADVNNYTPFLLNALKNIPIDININVIIGPSFKCTREIESIANSLSNIKLFYNPANMKKVISINDIAISSAGSSTYELALLGIPTILIVQADNQRHVAEKMDLLGLCKYIGDFDKLQKDTIKHKTNSLITNYNERVIMSRKMQGVYNASKSMNNIIISIKKYLINKKLI